MLILNWDPAGELHFQTCKGNSTCGRVSPYKYLYNEPAKQEKYIGTESQDASIRSYVKARWGLDSEVWIWKAVKITSEEQDRWRKGELRLSGHEFGKS